MLRHMRAAGRRSERPWHSTGRCSVPSTARGAGPAAGPHLEALRLAAAGGVSIEVLEQVLLELLLQAAAHQQRGAAVPLGRAACSGGCGESAGRWRKGGGGRAGRRPGARPALFGRPGAGSGGGRAPRKGPQAGGGGRRAAQLGGRLLAPPIGCKEITRRAGGPREQIGQGRRGVRLALARCAPRSPRCRVLQAAEGAQRPLQEATAPLVAAIADLGFCGLLPAGRCRPSFG